MNRIVIIGNGFDIAHGLKTGYTDFINSYWGNVFNTLFDGYSLRLWESYGSPTCLGKDYVDELVDVKVRKKNRDTIDLECRDQADNNFSKLCVHINKYNNSDAPYCINLKFKNSFFEHISLQHSLTNWVDIENEYYDELKKISSETDDRQKRNEKVRRLNDDFNAVKKKLEEYLSEISQGAVDQKESIENALSSSIKLDDIAIGKKRRFRDSISEARLSAHLSKHGFYNPTNTIFLNFNYTNTAEKRYLDKDPKHEVINIHGELNDTKNPIIFGYGDELDNDYKRIEDLQDNDFLENMKSINYHQTKNYRSVLEHLGSDLYQVFIMGHSCGNSDRTLLNTIFEHDNCISIKVFYHQKEDESDNYVDLIKNISRNFNNKQTMRDAVVNKEYCSPLVPK